MQGPPDSKWERATADAAGLSRTWGLTHQALQGLRSNDSPAMLEVHPRRQALQGLMQADRCHCAG